jgi:Tol biopolymer transport system component/DNA-binding winged helix-turn-helix (wHTH) protein
MTIAVKHLLGFGPFRIDPEQRLLFRGREPIPLSPKAFELLLVLAQRSGQVVLKDELMSLLWPDTFVEESNLGQHIFQLRKALGERAQDPSYIVTVPGRGYRFVHGVRAIPAQVDEEIVLETHSRSRLVIEEEEGLAERSPASATRLRRILPAALMVAVVLLLGAAAVLFSSSPPPKVLSVRQITHSGRVEPYGKILTDGLRLYFTERRGGTEALARVPVAGGEPVLISTSVPSLMVDDIDPSKSRLLIGTQGARFDEPLWVVSTEGGSARRVGDVLASGATAWSPDGHNIIYGHDAQVFTISEDGERPTKLLTAPGYVISLRPAPDGKLLRFTVRDSGSAGTHLWESSADGRNPHPLSFGWKTAAPQWGEGESAGDWTPDGRYFVFRAAHDGVEGLWAIRENPGWLRRGSSAPVQLYSSPDRFGSPQFSPDGKKIFFAIYQERRELVRYDSTQKTFVPYLSGIAARLLSFSKDGKWVTYRSDTDGALWRSRADGSEKLQLTFPPMVAYHSTWSPDGKRIVFGATLPGQEAKLFWVSPDGGTPEALTSSNGTDGGPSYSPDGRSIIFQRWTTNAEGTRRSAVYVLDLTSRQTRELPGSKDFDGVHWSPDGKNAAASDEANNRLMIFDFVRQQWSELADGAAYGWGIRWSADSRFVYYQHSQQGEEQPIFRVRVSDRKVEQITSARQILRADVLGYSMTGLTPDNAPLASLIRRDSDIYALEIDFP